MYIKGDGWSFMIDLNENKPVWYLYTGFATTGPVWSYENERDVIERVIKGHFEPRWIKDLHGNLEKHTPMYDDPVLYPEAFAAKARLEEYTIQQEMFA